MRGIEGLERNFKRRGDLRMGEFLAAGLTSPAA